MTGTKARLEAIVAWAWANARIEALILTGSLAREDGSADAHSDIDIEIISADPSFLIHSDRWITEFGEPLVVIPFDEESGQEWPTRLVIYADGGKVDFTLAGRERLTMMGLERELDPVYARGYRVLFDRGGHTRNLPAVPEEGPRAELPEQDEFGELVSEFWFEATHVPKYLERGDLWAARSRDAMLKDLLLVMMEWHAAAMSSGRIDVRHEGIGMAKWLDPATLSEVPGLFAGFDREGMQQAFVATTRLFSRLAREVSQRTGLAYPERVEAGLRSACNIPS